ncbi:hypothetical protein COU61_04855 [Candidatus Pacearchaeota archaeon CG10_big_fil_rev_8_21_14_0_10_35_13]|nr:MAG: hypothetical protein COU61_04855 [Candidatus Pacearchaeota archaeon CG10_big_fil_rev_8_21_14_0_10_35_13]
MDKLFVHFITHGCTANHNNSEIMKGLLSSSGMEVTNNPELADIFVINSCVVKGKVEKKIRKEIVEFSKSGKPVIVAGCMPNVRKKFFEDYHGSKVFPLGTRDTKSIVSLITDILNNSVNNNDFLTPNNKVEVKLNTPKIPNNKLVGITQILEGCTGHCSFCATKYAKGNVKSYPLEDVINNVRNDLRNGCKEIWLTSQDNGAYGIDLYNKHMLPELLSMITALPGNFRVRIGMMNPDHVLAMLPELLDAYDNPKVFKFLHLPIQSGSDKVLGDMMRNYSVDEFFLIIDSFKLRFPEIFFSTDLIVAYPTESEEDFLKSLSAVKRLSPQVLNPSKYWPMKPAPASKLPLLPSDISRARAVKISELHLGIAHDYYHSLVGKRLSVLIDNKRKKLGVSGFLGRCDNYSLIVIPNADKKLLGKFVNVRIVGAKEHYAYGEVVE